MAAPSACNATSLTTDRKSAENGVGGHGFEDIRRHAATQNCCPLPLDIIELVDRRPLDSVPQPVTLEDIQPPPFGSPDAQPPGQHAKGSWTSLKCSCGSSGSIGVSRRPPSDDLEAGPSTDEPEYVWYATHEACHHDLKGYKCSELRDQTLMNISQSKVPRLYPSSSSVAQTRNQECEAPPITYSRTNIYEGPPPLAHTDSNQPLKSHVCGRIIIKDRLADVEAANNIKFTWNELGVFEKFCLSFSIISTFGALVTMFALLKTITHGNKPRAEQIFMGGILSIMILSGTGMAAARRHLAEIFFAMTSVLVLGIFLNTYLVDVLM